MKLLAIVMLAVTTPALAQDASGLVSRAVNAYEGLELDAAAGMLRRALTPPLADSLTAAEHARALSYLGAIELLALAVHQPASDARVTRASDDSRRQDDEIHVAAQAAGQQQREIHDCLRRHHFA